jgi:hypothetical protein
MHRHDSWQSPEIRIGYILNCVTASVLEADKICSANPTQFHTFTLHILTGFSSFSPKLYHANLGKETMEASFQNVPIRPHTYVHDA